MFEKIVSCPNLPTLPAVAVELLERTRDPEVKMTEIATLVMRDQGLAARVMRTVNSSFYGLSKPCPTLERAIGLLGLKAIKALVLGFSMVRVTKGVTHLDIDLGGYWRRTICTAMGARHIAATLRSCDPDEAFTAGLFVDMGMLAAFVSVPKTYGPILQSAPAAHSKLAAVEVAELGFSHADIGAAIAEKWRMSDAIVNAVRYHHRPEDADSEFQELANVVAIGQLAADAILAVNPAQPMADLMISSKRCLRREGDDIEVLLDKISEAAMELGKILDQDVGDLPDAQHILARANDQLVEQQIAAQRETAQLQEKAEALEVQTVTDALTGAANRKRFDSEIQRLFNRSREQNKPLAALFIDADRFKSVNDTYGHKAGDAVLVELAARMMNLVGELGIVCRYGGEEFAILIPHATVDKAVRFAELLRKSIADKPFDLTGVDRAPNALPVTVSIGVSATDPNNPGAHPTASKIVVEADNAVYAAKKGGRNRVEVFKPEMAGKEGDPDDTVDVTRPPSSNVLLIEDDPIAAKYLRAALAGACATVTLVTCCADAIELIKRTENDAVNRVDLIVCEHRLPDGTSGGVIRVAKTSPSLESVRILVVTAAADPNIPAAAKAAGADGVYLKINIADTLDQWAQGVVNQADATSVAA